MVREASIDSSNIQDTATAGKTPRSRRNDIQWRSLKVRVTLATLAIFVIGIWALAFYSSRMLRQDMERLLGEQQFAAASFMAQEVNHELSDRLEALAIVAGSVTPDMLVNTAAMQAMLEQRPLLHRLFNSGVVAFQLDGTAIAEIPLGTGRIGVNNMDVDTIAAALKEGKTTVGRPRIGKRFAVPMLAMTVPIRDSRGKVIGALAGTTELDKPNFLDKITANRYGKTGGYRLVSPRHRMIVTAPDKGLIMKTLPATGGNPTIDRFMQGHEGFALMVDPYGTEVLAAAKGVPVADWYVAALLPTDEAFAPIRAMQQRMLLATIVLTLLAGLLTWWMVRRQLAPMLAAVETLAAMSNTDQPPRGLPITRQDEVGQLIGGFNRLLATLARREDATKEALERLQKIASHVPGIVFQFRRRVDGSACLPYASQALREIYRVDPEQVRDDAAPIFAAVHPDDLPDHLASIEASARNLTPWTSQYRLQFAGEPDRWLLGNALPQAEPDGSVLWHGFVSDVTERRKAEEKINDLAFFDQLTGLPNRTLLLDRLRQTLAASSRGGSYGALLFIDLDNFKTLNDTLGHDMGDLLLTQVARRLTLCVREGDTVARLGGDEFVVVLAGLGSNEADAGIASETVAEKILATLSQPYLLGKTPHHSTASIGVTLFRGDLATIDDLMKQADLAMYKSKSAGRHVVRFFDPTMELAIKERVTLEDDLRQAIEEKQFLLHYQAQVAGESRLTGAEVLLRWQHPVRGMVSPAEFIPLAEETGLILPLGHWVLETACAQLAVWAIQPEMAHLTLAVNVSAQQFREPGFVDQVLSILKNTGANPQRLKLELTESMLVLNVQEIIEKMFALKARGVGFALDDFGTGYSSLSYLKRLPLDQLKIDQSFVRDVLLDPNDAAIARTVVALARSLGLGVIAEGVETEVQRDFLATSGCHDYQGYFFSRPLPLDGFEQFAQR